MTVNFKDVGQGDSIILEWQEGDRIKIGLIDCNKKASSNPVLEYLKLLRNYSIEFIILSHPHNDHFSGMFDLLQFLRHEKAVVSNFFHTCASNREYIQASMKSISDKKILVSIFKMASEMHDLGLIVNYGFVNNLSSELLLTENIKLKVISPTHVEYAMYNKKAFKNNSLLNNNPDSNYLSTVLKLYNDKWFILFTSDAPSDVFWEINRSGMKLNRNKLLLGQIPHHGSKENYYSTFWRLLNHESETNVVISVGKNDYGHPSQDVIDDLKGNSYKVKQTYYEDRRYSASSKDLSSVMDLISESVSFPSDIAESADVIFKIIDDKLIEV